MRRLVWLTAYCWMACGPKATTLTAKPEKVNLWAPGQGQALSVTALDRDGKVISKPSVDYLSGDPAVASVDDDGVITARKSGNIKVIVRSASALAAVQVRVVIVKEISAWPPSLGFAGPGGNATLRPSVKDDQGQLVEDVPVHWSSSKAGVATVDQDGHVVASAAGDAVIIGTVGAGRVEVGVHVDQPEAHVQ